MMKSYSIRDYRSDDEGGIVELLELVYGVWPRFDLECSPLEHWRWKYVDNPMGNMIVPLAVSDDIIVGSNHGCCNKLKIGDRIISSSQGTDLVVHPDFRRMGIYTKLSEYKTQLYRENQNDLTWAVTGNPVVFESNMKWGRSTFPHPVSVFMRIRDINLHFKMRKYDYHVLKKYGFYVLKFVNRILYPIKKSYENDEIKDVSDIDSLDDKIDMLWDELKDHYDFILLRNANYFKWRYLNLRGGKYIVKIFEENEKIVGYVVLRISKSMKDYYEGHVVDLLALPDRLDVVESLLSDTLNIFDYNKINAVYCLNIENHPYESVLKRHGFINSKGRVYTIIQIIRELGDEWEVFMSSSPARIHFQYGDTDWI